MSQAGDDLRQFGAEIEAAAIAAGLAYLGKRYRKFSVKGKQEASAPVRDHFKAKAQARYGYAPLNPKYEAAKRREVGAKPILVYSGRLRNTSNDGDVSFEGDTIVITWTRIPEYGAFHHRGGRDLPRRSPYEPDAKNVADMAKAMQDFIDTAGRLENQKARRGANAAEQFGRRGG